MGKPHDSLKLSLLIHFLYQALEFQPYYPIFYSPAIWHKNSSCSMQSFISPKYSPGVFSSGTFSKFIVTSIVRIEFLIVTGLRSLFTCQRPFSTPYNKLILFHVVPSFLKQFLICYHYYHYYHYVYICGYTYVGTYMPQHMSRNQKKTWGQLGTPSKICMASNFILLSHLTSQALSFSN